MTAQEQQTPVDVSLNKKLVRQVEFYFSDFNLHRDKFMKEHMENGDGWFNMDIMLQFKRLASLCSEPGTILAALKESKLVEVDVEQLRMRRNPANPLPENDATYQRNLKMRTVHVSGFSGYETIEEMQEYFAEHGEVSGLRILRKKDQSDVHKGACFVTFNKLEESEKFLQLEQAKYKDLELSKMSTDDYNKKNKKKRAHESNQEGEGAKEIDTVTFLYVNGLSDEMIAYTDIKFIFEDADAPSFKYFYKFGNKQGTDGYAVMVSKEDAEKALEAIKAKNGDKFTVRTATEVTISTMPEDKLEEATECYAENRAKFLKPKKGGRFGGRNGGGRYGGRGGKRKFNKHNRSHKVFGDDEPCDNKKAKVEASGDAKAE